MKRIPLTRGKFAIVDDWAYDWLSLRKWNAVCSRGRWYATSYIKGSLRRHPKYDFMHRLLIHPFPGYEVDHIDGDGLNNQWSNLRVATHAENSCNRKRQPSRSGIKGVYHHGRTWTAKIGVGYKSILIGKFKTAMEAQEAYDIAARRLHGEFAHVNELERMLGEEAAD